MSVVKFVGKRYNRLADLDIITYPAAAALDRRYGRLIRRRPQEAAIVAAERLLAFERRRQKGGASSS